jgi:hypothetical protein
MTPARTEDNVVLLRRALEADVEAPFRKYRQAGLVNAQFGVDGGTPLFWGYHHPDRTWNGWATPKFRREVASLIADWINEVEPGTAWWEGLVLCLLSDDRAGSTRLNPDELGLYGFDGWTWLEPSIRG